MTNQEFFSRSVTHVMNQKVRCVANKTCAYAGPDGTSCAVGCVMPRELAQQADSLADSDVYSVIRDLPEAAELFKDVDVLLLDQCQTVHDVVTKRDQAGLDSLRCQFESIAEDFGLEMPNV
jgi:hypothetical protein